MQSDCLTKKVILMAALTLMVLLKEMQKDEMMEGVMALQMVTNLDHLMVLVMVVKKELI